MNVLLIIVEVLHVVRLAPVTFVADECCTRSSDRTSERSGATLRNPPVLVPAVPSIGSLTVVL